MPELIDKQALIADHRICGECSGFENCSGHITLCDSARARRAINEAPTISALPIIQGLILQDTDVNGNPFRYCSNCKCPIPDNASITNYCGCCGSQFVKEDKDAGDAKKKKNKSY